MTKKLAVFVCVILSLALASQAGQYWWSGNGANLGGNGTWDVSATTWGTTASGPFVSWPNGSSDAALFTNTAGTVTIAASTTITNNLLSFASTGFIVTNAAGGKLVMVGTAPTISVGSGMTGTVAAVIGGTAGLTFNGGGTVILGTNIYSGGTTISNATVRVSGVSGTLGSGTGGAVTINGGTLVISFASHVYPAWPLTIGSGGATFQMGLAGSTYFADNELIGSGTITLKSMSGGANRFRGLGSTQNNFSGKWVVDGVNLILDLSNGGGCFGNAVGDNVITMTNQPQFLLYGGTIGSASNGIYVADKGTLAVTGNSVALTRINAKISGPAKDGVFFVTAVNVIGERGTIELLNSSNSWAGITRVSKGTGSTTNSYLRMGVDEVIPNGAGKGDVMFDTAGGNYGMDLNGHTETINGLISTSTGVMIDNLSAGAAKLVVGDNDATANTFSGVFMNSGGALSLQKIGSGTQTLSGTNTYRGTTTVSGGELIMDKSGEVNGALGDLVLNGGALTVKGKSSGSSSQQFSNVLFVAGAHLLSTNGTVKITPNGGAGTTLTWTGDWTRQSNATVTVDASVPTALFKATSVPLANGIIGGYAMVTNSGGWGFAALDAGGNFIRNATETTVDPVVASGNLSANVNYLFTNNVLITGSAAMQELYSARIIRMGTGGDSERTIWLNSKTWDVKSGGLLFDTDNVLGVSGPGTLTSSTGELFLNLPGQRVVVSADLADYSPSVKLNVVKHGTGILQLYASPHTGDTVINQGELGFRGNASGKGNPVFASSFFVNQGGLLTFGTGGTMAMIGGLGQKTRQGGNVSTYGLAVFCVGNNNLDGYFNGRIYDNYYGGSGNDLTFIKIGTGTQILSGTNNNYRGGTILSNGVLSVSSTNNIGGANAKVTFAGGMLRITGTSFTNFNGVPLTFTSVGGGLDLVESGVAFTLTNNVPSGTSLTKSGAGTLSVSGSVNMLVTDKAATVTTAGGGAVSAWTVKSLTGGEYMPVDIEAVTGNLTLEGNYTFDLNTDGSGDKLTATGAVTMNSIVITISTPANLMDRSKVYTLVQGSNLSGTASLAPACVLPYGWKLKIEGNMLVVKYVSPGTLIKFY
jgi:autotransporter-associated beta strand protein